jgi:tetratricopeptide (TPR) repeat protein
VRQVQLEAVGEEAEDDEPTPAQAAAREREDAARRQRQEAQLRRAIAIDPSLADAYFGLSLLLRFSADGEPAGRGSEADTLLDRAVALAPDNLDFRAARADVHRMHAMQGAESVPEDERVVTYSGMAYVRAELELALDDFEQCARLDGSYRYLLRAGQILHDLGRYDEALARYDEALRRMPADSPHRQHVTEMRARSENNGAGERDEMAKLLEGLIGQGDRNLADDNVATMLMGAARAVRGGKSVGDALAARMSESPEDFMAANIAEQILNVAFEAPPQLVEVDAATFPAYQRRYAAKQRKALEAAGMRHVAYAEAAGMTPTLGQRVLLGLYTDTKGDAGVATFAMRPKWPGLVGFLVLFLKGKWKTHTQTECVTLFDDEAYFTTQYENISPFGYGGTIDIERLPRATRVDALAARHRERIAAYRAAHPHARPFATGTLADADANWRRGQAIKRAYRRSIGYATDAELRGMLGAHYDRLGEKVRAKLDELSVDREERMAED